MHAPEPKPPRHNEVSAALVVRYGKTTLVLGGDVESLGWTRALALLKRLNLGVAAHFVKVSHHGSTNGYCPELWQLFSADRRPLACVEWSMATSSSTTTIRWSRSTSMSLAIWKLRRSPA